jgi:hypothetical protein
MTKPGRDHIAAISRQCRALVARQAQLPNDTDPGKDPVICGLLDEVTQLPVPHHSLQFMGAMVLAMHRRLVRVLSEQGRAEIRLDEARRVMAEDGQTHPELLTGCFAILEALSVTPRDNGPLADALAVTGNKFGVYAHLTLSALYLRFARTVVNADPNIGDLDQLLAEVSLAEEILLIEQGEG